MSSTRAAGSVPGPPRSASALSPRCRRRSCCADRQPSYVASWIYVFGVLSLASLAVIILSGTILALKGPAWWHLTGIGHFFNSIHLWSVELFFFFMVIHLWGKYWMSAWRGGRARDLGDRRGHVPGRDPVRADRLRLAAELRLAVDLDPGQGRDERGRHRLVLQPAQLRADVQLPHLPAAGRGRGDRRSAHVLLVRKHGVVPPLELRSRSEPAKATAPPTVRDRRPRA